MSSRLLFAGVAGFLVGVFARSFLMIGFSAFYFSILLACVALLFIFVEPDKRNTLLTCAVLLVAFACGIIRMNSMVLIGDPSLSSRLDTKVIIEGVVSDEPDVRENGTRLSVQVDTLVSKTGTTSISGGVLVLAPPHLDILYGDHVRASGTLRLPQAFDTGGGREFNYPFFLAKDGIGYELAFAQADKVSGRNSGNILKTWAISVKIRFLNGLAQGLPEPEAGLAGGITVGAKRGLGQDLNDAFKKVSLVHIVVLSGYNITVVINAIGWALSRVPRMISLVGGGFVAILFALMTGGAAASVRAAAMAVIATVGRATGRVYLASRALAVVVLGMVVWNPFILGFDPGFQLSVLATLGLIFLTPSFAQRLQKIPEKFGIREIAASTLGTQLAVLPLLLYQNGQVPIFSLPANVFALVAVPPAMFFSMIAAIEGVIFAPLAPIIAFPAYILLAYIIDIARFFSSLPFSSISISAFSAWWLFLLYALMIGTVVYTKTKRRE